MVTRTRPASGFASTSLSAEKEYTMPAKLQGKVVFNLKLYEDNVKYMKTQKTHFSQVRFLRSYLEVCFSRKSTPRKTPRIQETMPLARDAVRGSCGRKTPQWGQLETERRRLRRPWPRREMNSPKADAVPQDRNSNFKLAIHLPNFHNGQVLWILVIKKFI